MTKPSHRSNTWFARRSDHAEGGFRDAPVDPLHTETDYETRRRADGTSKSASHQRSRRRGWSINGAERSQTVATGGKADRPQNGSNKPEPSPTLANSCAHNEMVRRGFNGSSPLEGLKYLQIGYFCCLT
jgi:hypothetical protein